MAKAAATGRGPRLGTQFRGKLAAAYGQRGVGPNSLWYVYSPRAQRDWVLRSDLEWDHFVLAEADPSIATCSYEPKLHSLIVDKDTLEVPVDVTVAYRDGSIEWRRIRFAGDERNDDSTAARQLGLHVSAVKNAGMVYRLMTEETIRANHVLLANWRRAVAWMAAARERSLVPYQLELARALRADGTLGTAGAPTSTPRA